MVVMFVRKSSYELESKPRSAVGGTCSRQQVDPSRLQFTAKHMEGGILVEHCSYQLSGVLFLARRSQFRFCTLAPPCTRTLHQSISL